MRWAQIFAAIGAIVCLAGALPGDAFARASTAPIQVSSPQTTAAPGLAGPRPSRLSFHDLQLEGQEWPVRAGRDAASGDWLVDATGLGAVLGRKFERRGTAVIFDRPASEVRATLDLETGHLSEDGLPSKIGGAAGIVAGERLWLNLDALEALTGATGALAAAGGQAPPQAAPAPRTMAATPGTGFQLAAWAPGEGASGTSRHNDWSPPAGTVSSDWAPVFGEPIRQTADEADGRHDWRTADSWQIEESTARQAQPGGLQPAIARSVSSDKQADRLLHGGLQPAMTQSGSVETRRPEVRQSTVQTGQAPESKLDHAPRETAPAQKLLWQAAYALVSRAAETSPDRPSTNANNRVVQKNEARGGSALYGRNLPIKPARALAETMTTERGSKQRGIDHAELSGRVFLDVDGDGRPSAGDQRLEGEVIRLVNLSTTRTTTRYSAAFGQFGLSGLAPGRYRLSVMIGWQEHRMTIDVPQGASDLDVDFAIPFEAVPQPPTGVTAITL